MVPGEQQLPRQVVEHQVASGVAGGLDRVQHPVAEVERAGRKPLVRQLPVAPVVRRGVGERRDLVGQRAGADPTQPVDLDLQRYAAGLLQRLDRRPLARADADPEAWHVSADVHRLGVVVAVGMGHQEAPHVVDGGAEARQRLVEQSA